VALADSLQGRTTNAAKAFWIAVGCVVAFFALRLDDSKKRGQPRLCELDNMSLGALNPLHVYVKHDVEVTEEIAAPESDGTLDFIPIKF
jgi:hypothetical protein